MIDYANRGSGSSETQAAENSKDTSFSKPDRTVLPMPNTARPELVVYDAKDPDAVFPAIPQVRPPEGSPNVLVVLLDDVGFGASSTFCQTPTLERLAAGGLKYNRHNGAVFSNAAGAFDWT